MVIYICPADSADSILVSDCCLLTWNIMAPVMTIFSMARNLLILVGCSGASWPRHPPFQMRCCCRDNIAEKMVFVFTELRIFSRRAVLFSLNQELPVTVLLYLRWLDKFGCLYKILLLQHEVMELHFKAWIPFPVQATQEKRMKVKGNNICPHPHCPEHFHTAWNSPKSECCD